MSKGTFIQYVPKKFSDERLLLIARANEIVEEYESKGYTLTLRQLYYQHVARGLIENSDRSYDRLGSLINDARMAGLISWTAIEDRGRSLQGLATQPSPGAAMRAAARAYKRDLWETQPFRPEVWVEKAALEGVVGHICDELRVDFFACRGYNSQSEQWRAGRRFAGYVGKGQVPIVFHLGDHDPSGIDMTRDNRERLATFAGVDIQVVRLALNMDQIERLRPPPNPAKISDSRYADYQRTYGDHSWELDALDPAEIHRLIRDAIARVRNAALWEEALREEVEERQAMTDAAEELGL
jgi:hypothetical protein